ncbi:MAG: toxin-antitoxin system HicB family antitoxin [Candidatus Sumerlaeota bacterium]|nr:toxin-antitoxin system HicB family antitoxin [Candidatus Sumerlaeota bacterium]
MSTLSLRIPDSLHGKARELAKRDHVSVNQMITTALAEKISALATDDYLEVRATRGSRIKFRKALAKVPHCAPLPGDEL